MKYRMPDFYIVGAPKCGTTTIYAWLSGHPQINAPHKEACFFSQDIYPTESMATHISTLSEYCEIFSLGKGQVVSGEATPKYLYSDRALSQISRLNPEAKIIVCLRDPVELVISLHNQKIREGIEKEVDFKKAWVRSRESLNNAEDDNTPHEINYYYWGCIGSRLEKLYSFFDTDSVLVLTTKELHAQPRNVYSKILKFIGVPDDGRVDFTNHNERVAIKSVFVHHLFLSLRGFLLPVLKRFFPGYKGSGIMRLLYRVNSVKGGYVSSVDDDFKKIVYEELSAEIDLAERYLNGEALT